MPVVTDERWKYSQLQSLTWFLQELREAVKARDLGRQLIAATKITNHARRMQRAASK